ncbi:unnamed protein product, partial [Sphagnum jensenii]
CNCNNHATRCHFDPAVYEATGKESGGVCDECQHNTMGRNCEQCKPYFYRDPGRRIEDQYVCQRCKACDCDLGGSYDGSCDIASGQCNCRPHVTGRRCDTPDQSYFVPYLDYIVYNAELAKACNCDPTGSMSTVCNNLGGSCQCKANIDGRQCDRCKTGYYGFGPEGCK